MNFLRCVYALHPRKVGFNQIIWNVAWIVAPLALLIYGVVFLRLKKGFHYFMDPKDNTDARLADAGTFEGHLGRYCDAAKLLIALAGGVTAFLINALAVDKPSAFVTSLASSIPIIIGFSGFRWRRSSFSLLP